MGTPRITASVEQVLLLFLAEPTRERYGLEVARLARLPRGTLYRILMRMEEAGWLESAWEDVDPALAGRPARRLYRPTSSGREQAEGIRLRLAAAVGYSWGVETP